MIVIINILLALLGLASLLGLVVCTVALRNRAECRARIEEIHTEIEKAGVEARQLWKEGDPSYKRVYDSVVCLNREHLSLEDRLRSSWF